MTYEIVLVLNFLPSHKHFTNRLCSFSCYSLQRSHDELFCALRHVGQHLRIRKLKCKPSKFQIVSESIHSFYVGNNDFVCGVCYLDELWFVVLCIPHHDNFIKWIHILIDISELEECRKFVIILGIYLRTNRSRVEFSRDLPCRKFTEASTEARINKLNEMLFILLDWLDPTL